MADFVFPYDLRTGERVERPVPRNWVGHPKLGSHLTLDEPTPEPEADESADDDDDSFKE